MAARAVVVSIAFGAPSHRLFRLLAASLRATGWRGDILVLTDSAIDLPRELAVEQRILTRAVINTDPYAGFRGAEIDCRDYPDPNNAGPPIKALTPLVHRWLDMERYDVALFLDADILVLKDLHAAADDLAQRRRPFGVGLNVGSLKGTPAANAHLTWLELRRWKKRPCLNTGFFYFRPERAAMGILKAWEIEMTRRIAGDQAALQAIYLRRFSDGVEVLPHSFQGFAPMPRVWDGNVESLPAPASFLMHFRGAIASPDIMTSYARRRVPAAVDLLGGPDAV